MTFSLTKLFSMGTLFLFILVCSVFGLNQNDLLFYVPFDNAASPLIAQNRTPELMVSKGNSWVPGVMGEAISAGTAGSVLSYPAMGNLDYDAGTLSFWVKIGWTPKVQKDLFHSFFRVQGKFDCFFHWGQWLTFVWMQSGTESGFGMYPGPPFSAETKGEHQWHHVVVTWDQAGNFKQYMNGKLGHFHSFQRPAWDGRNFFNAQDTLIICDPSRTVGDVNRSDIDELMIFNRPLDPTEIKTLYRRPIASVAPTKARIGLRSSPIIIDGRRTAGEWDSAFETIDFSELLFGQLREDAVRLNLAYDQDGLYLAISDQKKIDGLENNDWQLIFLMGEKKEDRRFVCSLDQTGNLKQSDTLKWEAKAQEAKDTGATLEAKIPWGSLGLENPAEGQKLRVKILRGSLREGVPLLGWGDSKVRGEGAVAEIILGGNEGTVRLSRIGNPSQCRLDLEAQIAGKTAKGHMDVFLQPSVLKEYYDPKTMPGTRSFTGKEIYHKQEFTGGALRFKESFDDADVNSMLIRIVDADGRLMYQSQRQFIANLPIVSTVKTLPGHERVEIQADVSQYRPSKKSKLTGRVRLFDPAGKEIKKAVIAGFPSPVQKVDVSMKGLPEGKILVRTTLYENNQEVFTHESSFVMMETRPDWIVHPAGAERRVTNDFIPLTLKQDDKAFVIGMWGREYRYAKDSLLPSGIVSQTRQLLARPAEFRFSSGKEDSKSGSIPIRILEQSPDRIRFVLQKRYDRFMVSTENTIEFDGMQWTTITIKPLKNRSSLEKVSLEFPLVPDNSTLIHRNYCGVSSKQFSGKTPDRWNSGFAPIVWIGNEYVGHCFFIETPAGLQIQDSARFYEVERTDRETLLRVNFVDQKITLDKPITFSFGWFATPSRPLPENWLSWAYYGRPGEEYKGTEFQVLLNDRCFDESNQFLHEAHPWKWFTDQAKIAHESGRHFLKYTSTHYLSFYKNWTKDALDQKKSLCKEYDVQYEETPERKFWAPEWEVVPGKPELCTNTSWQDLICAGIRDRIEKGQVGGIYFDCAFPMQCSNPLHGCNGRYGILSQREIRRRLTNLFEANDRKALVMEHLSENLLGPQMSFIDFALDGEQLSGGAEDYRKELSLDRMRVLSIGTNWGMIPITLFYEPENSIAKTDSFLAIWALHMPIHCIAPMRGWPVNLWHAYSLDREFDFDKQSRRLGYWENGQVVKVTPEEVKVTLYHKPGKVLLVASNLSDRKIDAKIDLNVAPLGLDAEKIKCIKYLENQEQAPQYSDGRLRCSLKPNSCIICILSEE